MLRQLFHRSTSERLRMITEGSLKKTFLTLAAPGLLMVVIQALMPILDGLIVYNYDSAVSGAAISYTASLQSIFISAAKGLSLAGSVIVGQLNGGGDVRKAQRTAGQQLAITVLFGILVIPVMIALAAILTNQDGSDIDAKILLYTTVLAFTMPFMVCQDSFNSIKSVFGHPETILVRALLFIPIKLFFSALYIIVLKMGILGAALSSLSAYFCIFLFIVYDLFLHGPREERLMVSDLKIEKPVLKKYLEVSWPSILQNCMKQLALFIAKQEAYRYGPLIISAQSIASDLTNFSQNLSSGFDSAIIPFVSINVGADNGKRAKAAAGFAIRLGIVISAVMTAVSLLAGGIFVRFYSDDPQLIAVAERSILILACGLVSYSVLFNEMYTFIGLGMNKRSLVIQLVRLWGVRLGVLYILTYCFDGIGADAIVISLSAANIVGAVISHLLYRKIDWTKPKMIK